MPRGSVYQTCNKPRYFSRDPKYKKYNIQIKQQKDKISSRKPKGVYRIKKDSGKDIAKS